MKGLVPADRYFGAAPEILKTLKARVSGNALALARHGAPKAPFYLTGHLGEKSVSLHAEGERLILVREDGSRQEVDWSAVRPSGAETPAGDAPKAGAELPAPVCPEGQAPSGAWEGEGDVAAGDEPPAPGVSALDDGLARIAKSMEKGGQG